MMRTAFLQPFLCSTAVMNSPFRMGDELEKRWNKTYTEGSLRFDRDKALLKSIADKKKLKAAVKKADLLVMKDVPYTEIIFSVLLVSRLYSAISGHITDCDETYNYWEPTHFLVFKNGFQTWEYNPKFALRSWFYIGMHAAVAKLSNFIMNHKIYTFYFMRMLLGMCCAIAEDQFYTAVYRKFGAFIANCWLLISLFAPGMYISSTAYLPSSFAMYCVMLAYAAWLDGSNQAAVIWIAAGSIVGWPFVAILGIPIFWDIVVKNGQFKKFAEYFTVGFVYTISPVVLVDLMLYRKLMIAPLNIVIYNVFNIHGSELYGTEPASYYLYNGFLNFNIAFLFALLSLPVYIIYTRFSDRLTTTACYLLMPMYMWLAVMLLVPHKEERFLYPIYPLIAFAASVVLFVVWRATSAIWSYFYKHMKEASMLNIAGFFTIYIFLSATRICALESYYRGPMVLYKDVYKIPEPKAVICVGKEWHRFPSSFFLPDGAKFHFVQSNFKGQLPQKFHPSINGTFAVNPKQNDANREEPSVYVAIK